MKKTVYSSVFGFIFTALLASNVTAAPISITYDNFGALPEATFGGSGIANNAVAITNYVEEICTTRCRPSGVEITLGLASHGRYENLSEGNDGAGTYFASSGSNTPPSSTLEGATWNFDFFIDVVGSSFESYTFKLFYDFDPLTNNDESTHGVFDINTALALFSNDPLSSTTRYEGSQNLLFSFLSVSSPFITAPSPVSAFDPDAAGEYTFALAAFRLDQEVSRTAMRVVVENVQVSEPGALALLCLGLVGVVRRKRLNRSVVFKPAL